LLVERLHPSIGSGVALLRRKLAREQLVAVVGLERLGLVWNAENSLDRIELAHSVSGYGAYETSV